MHIFFITTGIVSKIFNMKYLHYKLNFFNVRQCKQCNSFHYLTVISTYKRVLHSLTDSIEPWRFYGRWVTNFCIQIGFEALNPTKDGPFPLEGQTSKIRFRAKVALNHPMMIKLRMGRLDLNAKKTFSAN